MHFGEHGQLIAAAEELCELSIELLKLANKKRDISVIGDRAKVIDELADASIMINQMVINFDLRDSVEDRIDYKLEKLSDKIDLLKRDNKGVEL